MFCSRCGKQLPEDAVFCTGCGYAVKTESQRTSPDAPQYASYPSPSGSYTPPVNPYTPGAVPPSYSVVQDSTEPMTFKQWLTTLLFFLIPIANIVFLFIWAFGGPINLNKRNFAKAYLVFMAIAFGVGMIIELFVVFFMLAIFSHSGGSMFQ